MLLILKIGFSNIYFVLQHRADVYLEMKTWIQDIFTQYYVAQLRITQRHRRLIVLNRILMLLSQSYHFCPWMVGYGTGTEGYNLHYDNMILFWSFCPHPIPLPFSVYIIAKVKMLDWFWGKSVIWGGDWCWQGWISVVLKQILEEKLAWVHVSLVSDLEDQAT